MEVVEKFPELGYSSGEFEEYPGFYWEREVEELFIPDVRQVTLRVIFDERQPDAVQLLYYVRDRRPIEEIAGRLGTMGHRAVAPENDYWRDNGLTFEDPDGWRVVLYHGAYPARPSPVTDR